MTIDLVRVSKLMSLRGMCSRREAEYFISLKQVIVNGEIVATQGVKAPVNAKIELLSTGKKIQQDKVTILLNKPVGYVSTQPEKGYRAAIDLVTSENQFIKNRKFLFSYKKKLSVAGRLDIDSKGLLVLSQDGTLVKKLIGPDCNMEKEYIVRVEGNVNEKILEKLSFGLCLDGKSLKKANINILEPFVLKFILREGKKRQIRRMCELVGLRVVSLKRVRVGRVNLNNLPIGKWRFLNPNETF